MRKLTIKDNDVFIELDGIITAIVGPTNSGKTVILKKLCNRIENKDVKIDDVPIDEYDINFLRNNQLNLINFPFFPNPPPGVSQIEINIFQFIISSNVKLKSANKGKNCKLENDNEYKEIIRENKIRSLVDNGGNI